ncbi:sulfatase [Maribacter aestuarii]|uniref:sulfatase n=1 Tax=Maribacter aestuarii TaxID=1130723 RepID=UPI0025A684A6|nr:sulfatase [Maribacter aestuarii]
MFLRYQASLFILLLILLNGCTQQSLPISKKPNVLFILVDDLGLVDLGITGSTFYETPNIDKLAKEGMIFTQGYAASRVCSPSRASIMTGKFTARHGITDWIGAKSGKAWGELGRHDKLLPADYVHNLPKKEITLAEAFKKNGYKTFFAGKWHLGQEGSYPEDHGFDINVGGWDKGSPIGGYFSPWENPKLDNKVDGENLSLRLARETSSFIEKHKDSIFFAFLSFYAVHGPIQTNKGLWKKYREKAVQSGIAAKGYGMERVLPIRQVQDNPIYAGLVAKMDEAVGVVLNTLRNHGLEENTIVIFTSDNGGVASGDNFSTTNLPLRGGKGYQWEGGIREPYFIKVPWIENKGLENQFPVTGTDFYPTILDLVDANLLPNQHVDGISLRPLLEGKEIKLNRPLFWHYPHYGNQGGNPSSIIQKNGWKLIHYWEDGRDELYNVYTDIGEQNNLSKKFPDRVLSLRSELLSWLKEVNAKTPSVDERFDAKLAAARREEIINQKLPALEKERLLLLSEDFKPNPDWWGSQLMKD